MITSLYFLQVMSFLLKVKRAKFVLDKARKWMWKVLLARISEYFVSDGIQTCISETISANRFNLYVNCDFYPIMTFFGSLML